MIVESSPMNNSTFHALSAITHGAITAIQENKTKEELQKENKELKEQIRQLEKTQCRCSIM